MIFNLPVNFFVESLSAFAFLFLLAGFLHGLASIFWKKKRKWIITSLFFLGSFVGLFILSYFVLGFVWDIVVMEVIALASFLFALRFVFFAK